MTDMQGFVNSATFVCDAKDFGGPCGQVIKIELGHGATWGEMQTLARCPQHGHFGKQKESPKETS